MSASFPHSRTPALPHSRTPALPHSRTPAEPLRGVGPSLLLRTLLRGVLLLLAAQLAAAAAEPPAAVAPPATPPDLVAPLTAALAAGNPAAARQAFAALFTGPADQRPSRLGMDLLEARLLVAERQWQPAAELLAGVVAAPGATAAEQQAAWELMALCQTALGDDSAAAAARAQADTLFAQESEAKLAPSSQYFRNRFAFDGDRAYAAARLADTARAAAAVDRRACQAEALFARCGLFPDEPRFREHAAAAGDALLALAEARFRETGPPEETAALAEACLLRALDSGLDRAFAAKALLAENQVQLDSVCLPPPEALLKRLLSGLNACEQRIGTGRGTSDEKLADFADAYQKVLALTYRPDSAAAIAALSSLAERADPPWSWLALLELARAHLRDGAAEAAVAVLARIAPPRRLFGLADSAPTDRLFVAERELLQGVAASCGLDYRQAAKHFGQAADLGGPLLAPRARFEQARALELAGDWRRAATAYAGLCPGTPPGRLVSPDPSSKGAAADVAEYSHIAAAPGSAVLARESTPPSAIPSSSGSAGRPASTAAMGALYSARPSAAVDMLRGARGAWQVPRPSETSSCAPIPPSIARAAAVALRRLAEFATDGGRPQRSPVQILPDDRTTRGDWFLGYGAERYVLCAQNYRLDRSGGPLAEFAVRFATTDPKEPSRLWVSARQTDDPAALWDPVRRLRLPANRDDRGEQYPVGGGPDLLLDGAIPAGTHVLALYFVNDHHYYEANRRYTLEFRENGALLALADVRDFGGGVYKRLRVDGPCALRIRIRRDAAMNVLLQGVFLDADRPVQPVPVATVSLAAAAWAESERLRRKGCLRASEAAFDRFVGLASLGAGDGGAQERLSSALAELVRREPDVGRSVFRLNVGPPGTHRWERLWNAWFDALPDVPTARTACLEGLLFSSAPHAIAPARVRALALLREANAIAPHDLPRYLAAAGMALKELGRKDDAKALLAQALDAGAPERSRRGLLISLLALQAGTDSEPDAIAATYADLKRAAAKTGDHHVSAAGALLAAHACARGRHYDQALSLLAESPATTLAKHLDKQWRTQRQDETHE